MAENQNQQHLNFGFRKRSRRLRRAVNLLHHSCGGEVAVLYYSADGIFKLIYALPSVAGVLDRYYGDNQNPDVLPNPLMVPDVLPNPLMVPDVLPNPQMVPEALPNPQMVNVAVAEEVEILPEGADRVADFHNLILQTNVDEMNVESLGELESELLPFLINIQARLGD